MVLCHCRLARMRNVHKQDSETLTDMKVSIPTSSCFCSPAQRFGWKRLNTRLLSTAAMDGLELPSKENATKFDAWPPHNHEITYDWTKPTVQVYKDKQCDFQWPDQFQQERQRLDYNYHDRLIYTRLLFQDSVIGKIRGDQIHASPRPWLIFTAGAMGVGKGYVLTQLKQMQVLDASEFVKIDPDMIKSELPEMAGFEHSVAATRLHPESTQMADVLLEHALSRSLHMIVDGSLRDVDYYKHLIQRIRREYPTYRIAIIHVTAEPETIRQRARNRSGRAVPEDLVQKSIEQVPRSVEALTPVVDAVHVIQNEGDSPLRLKKSLLRSLGAVDTDEMMDTKDLSWQAFAMSWGLNRKIDVCSPMSVCMEESFQSTEAHDVANAIWKSAYPNFCPRCTVSCDSQCGLCSHGRHRCACTECR